MQPIFIIRNDVILLDITKEMQLIMVYFYFYFDFLFKINYNTLKIIIVTNILFKMDYKNKLTLLI